MFTRIIGVALSAPFFGVLAFAGVAIGVRGLRLLIRGVRVRALNVEYRRGSEAVVDRRAGKRTMIVWTGLDGTEHSGELPARRNETNETISIVYDPARPTEVVRSPASLVLIGVGFLVVDAAMAAFFYAGLWNGSFTAPE